MQCSGETGPGHVWSSTSDNQLEPETDVQRVVIAIGCMPPMRELGNFVNSTSLFIHEHLTPSMMDVTGTSYVAPVSRGGWKLSHIAFHRLLEIETEMSIGESYRRMFDEAESFARPLCFIVSELLRLVKQKQVSASLYHTEDLLA